MAAPNPVEQARQTAIHACPKAMETVLKIMDDPERNATARLAAARTILEISGVTAAINAEQAMEVLLTGLRSRMTEPAYGELTRAFLAIKGVVVDATTH